MILARKRSRSRQGSRSRSRSRSAVINNVKEAGEWSNPVPEQIIIRTPVYYGGDDDIEEPALNEVEVTDGADLVGELDRYIRTPINYEVSDRTAVAEIGNVDNNYDDHDFYENDDDYFRERNRYDEDEHYGNDVVYSPPILPTLAQIPPASLCATPSSSSLSLSLLPPPLSSSSSSSNTSWIPPPLGFRPPLLAKKPLKIEKQMLGVPVHNARNYHPDNQLGREFLLSVWPPSSSCTVLGLLSQDYVVGHQIAQGGYGTIHSLASVTQPDIFNMVLKKYALHKNSEETEAKKEKKDIDILHKTAFKEVWYTRRVYSQNPFLTVRPMGVYTCEDDKKQYVVLDRWDTHAGHVSEYQATRNGLRGLFDLENGIHVITEKSQREIAQYRAYFKSKLQDAGRPVVERRHSFVRCCLIHWDQLVTIYRLAKRLNEAPISIVHGDLTLPNLLFRYADPAMRQWHIDNVEYAGSSYGASATPVVELLQQVIVPSVNGSSNNNTSIRPPFVTFRGDFVVNDFGFAGDVGYRIKDTPEQLERNSRWIVSFHSRWNSIVREPLLIDNNTARTVRLSINKQQSDVPSPPPILSMLFDNDNDDYTEEQKVGAELGQIAPITPKTDHYAINTPPETPVRAQEVRSYDARDRYEKFLNVLQCDLSLAPSLEKDMLTYHVYVIAGHPRHDKDILTLYMGSNLTPKAAKKAILTKQQYALLVKDGEYVLKKWNMLGGQACTLTAADLR